MIIVEKQSFENQNIINERKLLNMLYYVYYMTKNPFINAVAATLYIAAIVSFMFFGLGRSHPDNSVFFPIAFISLFTLSAAVMGYLFLYQPLMLFLDGHKKHAVNLFLQTVGVFAGITAIFLVLLFSGVIK